MNDRFRNVPVDDDTEILASLPARFGDLEVLYQKWRWEGITAESLIFVADDVRGLTDAELQAEVRSSPLINSGAQVTIRRETSGYTFVNFNFSS